MDYIDQPKALSGRNKAHKSFPKYESVLIDSTMMIDYIEHNVKQIFQQFYEDNAL